MGAVDDNQVACTNRETLLANAKPRLTRAHVENLEIAVTAATIITARIVGVEPHLHRQTGVEVLDEQPVRVDLRNDSAKGILPSNAGKYGHAAQGTYITKD